MKYEMQIFEIKNKTPNAPLLVIAKNKNRAIEIAMQCKRAKKKENLTIVEKTNSYSSKHKSIKDLLSLNKEGPFGWTCENSNNGKFIFNRFFREQK